MSYLYPQVHVIGLFVKYNINVAYDTPAKVGSVYGR